MAESKLGASGVISFSTPRFQSSVAGRIAESEASKMKDPKSTTSSSMNQKSRGDFEIDSFTSPAIGLKDIKKIEDRLFEIRQSLQHSFSVPSEVERSRSSTQTMGLGPNTYQDLVMLMDEKGVTTPTLIGRDLNIEEGPPKAKEDDSVVADYLDQMERDLSGLIEEFFKIYTANTKSLDPLEAVKEYEKACYEHLPILENAAKKLAPGQRRYNIMQEKVQALRSEMFTWRLIASIYKDRLLPLEENMELDNSFFHLLRTQSDKKLIENLYNGDSEIRQAQLVIDWLENNARDDLPNFQEKVEYFSRQVCWENTLHDLLFPEFNKAEIVKEIDPDAPMRSGLPLVNLDDEDDLRLMKHVYKLVRCGQVTSAQELCIKYGQAWRAATLEGWKMWHDGNLEVSDGGKLHSVEGNPHRDIWKISCWKLANEAKFNAYERAVYASLSGNIKMLVPVCESWDDYLWAYYKCYVDGIVEQEVRGYLHIDRPLEPLPQGYEASELTPTDIFDNLDNSQNELIKQQAAGYFRIVQKHIILDDVNELFPKSMLWIESAEKSVDILRFLAHLVLFLKTVTAELNDDLCDNIIQLYVQALIKAGKMELIATYTAALPLESQITVYAKFLEDIHDKNERQKCLRLGEQAGLDTDAITKAVVISVHQFGRSEMTEAMDVSKIIAEDISEIDKEKIDAIEWMIFNPAQRIEAMKHANAVMRYFLACKKCSAAREVFRKLPSGSIDLVFKQWQVKAGDAKLPADDENAIREHLCIQAYLDAHEAFTSWFQQYHHGKPIKPELTEDGRQQTIAKIAYEEKEKEFRLDMERWERNIEIYTKDAVEKLYNVLLFVDGGWMVDAREDVVLDDTRHHQLVVLRQLCLPRICFLLQSILHSTEQYEQSLCLADVIASERYRLFETFRADEMQQFLRLLCNSAKEVLSQPSPVSNEENENL